VVRRGRTTLRHGRATLHAARLRGAGAGPYTLTFVTRAADGRAVATVTRIG
jgi:hypothetical protein